MFTTDTTCWAMFCARGARSKTRKLWIQAPRLATISRRTRSSVRQKSDGERMTASGLAVRNEHVPKSPDGLDVARLRGVGLDDLPQARDLHVEAAVERLVLAAARHLHELLARQRDARVPRECLEHRELAGG